jgi:hypothetical protein
MKKSCTEICQRCKKLQQQKEVHIIESIKKLAFESLKKYSIMFLFKIKSILAGVEKYNHIFFNLEFNMSRTNAAVTSNFKLSLSFENPNVRDMAVVYENLTAEQANEIAAFVINRLNVQGKTVISHRLENIGNLTQTHMHMNAASRSIQCADFSVQIRLENQPIKNFTYENLSAEAAFEQAEIEASKLGGTLVSVLMIEGTEKNLTHDEK